MKNCGKMVTCFAPTVTSHLKNQVRSGCIDFVQSNCLSPVASTVVEPKVSYHVSFFESPLPKPYFFLYNIRSHSTEPRFLRCVLTYLWRERGRERLPCRHLGENPIGKLANRNHGTRESTNLRINTREFLQLTRILRSLLVAVKCHDFHGLCGPTNKKQRHGLFIPGS